MTRTLYAMAFVYPPDDDLLLPTPTYGSVWYFHLFTIVRAGFGIVGQNLIWLGIWNNLMQYPPNTTNNVFQPLFYLTIGLMIFIMTNTFR